MRLSQAICSLTLTVSAAALLAGCGTQGSSSSGAAAMTPAQIPISEDAITPDKTLKAGIRLTGETSFMSKHYGQVQGYFKGFTSTTAEVVTLSANSAVVFKNVDGSLTHTASFLGDATKKNAPWPSSFNGSASPSAAGTDIGTTNFSTGTLGPGKSSAVYNTGAPGFYMIGCYFHYLEGMRTVIIVK